MTLPRGTDRIGFSRPLFAVTMIGLGVMGLVQGHFAPIWSGAPRGLPGRQVLAYLCAAVSLASGAGMLWRRTAALAARALLAYLLLWMLLFRVPLVVRAPTTTDAWWATGETAVLMAAAWVLAARFAGDESGARPGLLAGGAALRIARALYGLGLVPFGVAHFTYLARTVSMVPGWLPGHLGWACFTGGAMIVAGLAIVAGVWARLAAALSAVELSLFTLLVWGPVLAAGADASQWNEFVDSWALAAAAWVVAESYRGEGWAATAWARARR